MTTDKKLYIALGVLVALGGIAYIQNRQQQKDLAAHSVETVEKNLPKVSVSDEDTKKIDKIEIYKPADTDGGAAENITLVKKGENDWVLDKPVSAKATASNVTSLLDNLKRLEVDEVIDPGKDSYAKFKLTDEKALHATFYKGSDKTLDLYFGENGGRGQMTRIAGKDGVYALKNYSSFLYSRDAKGWRDKAILNFDDKDVTKVSIENENGAFTFDKSGEDWKAKFQPSKGAAKDIDKFDKSKLENMIRAFKSLSASDFGDRKTPADVGLAQPKAAVTFNLKDGSKYTLNVGDTAEGSNRWVKKAGSDQIFSIGSWSADWATAKVDKFQKTEEKDKDKDKDKDKKDESAKAAPEEGE